VLHQRLVASRNTNFLQDGPGRRSTNFDICSVVCDSFPEAELSALAHALSMFRFYKYVLE
jgi:hypothetical protein